MNKGNCKGSHSLEKMQVFRNTLCTPSSFCMQSMAYIAMWQIGNCFLMEWRVNSQPANGTADFGLQGPAATKTNDCYDACCISQSCAFVGSSATCKLDTGNKRASQNRQSPIRSFSSKRAVTQESQIGSAKPVRLPRAQVGSSPECKDPVVNQSTQICLRYTPSHNALGWKPSSFHMTHVMLRPVNW